MKICYVDKLSKADKNLMDKDIKDSVICVTGAGGSIGSELCRKIITLSPKKLLSLIIQNLIFLKLEEKLKMRLPDEVELFNYSWRC